MGLVFELKTGRPARRFFDKNVGPRFGRAAALIQPMGAVLAPPPVYKYRDGWSMAGRMVDYLVRHDLAGAKFDVRKTGAFAGASLEPKIMELHKRPPTCAAHCLCLLANEQLAAEIEQGEGFLVAALGLSLSEALYRSGAWPDAFQTALDSGAALGGGENYEPTAADLVAVSVALDRYFEMADGKALFADVAEVMRHWRNSRADDDTEIGRLRLVTSTVDLEFKHLPGGADPDLICRDSAAVALLDIKTIVGSISADEVRQLVSYLLLGGKQTAEVSRAGIVFTRRAEIRTCNVAELLECLFGDADLAKWSRRFQGYLREAYPDVAGVT